MSFLSSSQSPADIACGGVAKKPSGHGRAGPYLGADHVKIIFHPLEIGNRDRVRLGIFRRPDGIIGLPVEEIHHIGALFDVAGIAEVLKLRAAIVGSARLDLAI